MPQDLGVECFGVADPDWTSTRIWSGLSSGEGLISSVRDPVKGTERIKAHGEVRYEEVIRSVLADLPVAQKG